MQTSPLPTVERAPIPTVTEVAAILAKLVAVPSVSSVSNLPVLDLIEELLADYPVAMERVPYVEGKANLIVRIGPSDEPPVVLSGHTDVVPVVGQSWSSDPFTLTYRDGAYYGRGSADMKGFIALCLALVPVWIQAPLKRPIVLVFSPDEEIGCRGVVPAVRELAKAEPAPWGVVVGEPTDTRVVTREKGNITLETTVTGAAGHSADPASGINAIVVASQLIQKIDEIAQAQVGQGDQAFSVPHTTINIGLIEGGVQKNIIPDRCWFRWEIRPVSSQDAQSVLAQVERAAQEITAKFANNDTTCEIKTTVMNEVPSLEVSEDQAFLNAIMLAARANDTGAVSFASEAGHFQNAGMPVVLCGPGRIEVAHKADEHIWQYELAEGLSFLLRLTLKDCDSQADEVLRLYGRVGQEV